MNLNKLIPSYSIAFFRIAFGTILFWETLKYFYYTRISRFYIEPKFFFSYIDWLKPLPEIGIYFLFALMAIAAILVAIGLFYRYASILLFLIFTYIFLLDKTRYMNHHYLVVLITFMMIYIPATNCWAIDNILYKKAPKATPLLWLYWLRFQIAIVYIYAAIAKMNTDWFSGDANTKMLR